MPSAADDPPLEIDVSAAADILRRTDSDPLLLLDCRTPEEHAIARIEGGVLIPMQELPGRLGELDRFRGAQIIVHCHHGMRSLRVARWLRDQGFGRAASMAGGIDAWSEQIDPQVPRY
ncbi:MAG: rhodanese-like domain-containing protein [Pirellulales bacterium]|jgi:rhodanese-related sulfurtransferase